MTPNEMVLMCVGAINTPNLGKNVSIVLPIGWKRPPKFPRGELLCESERGRVYSMDPIRLLAWLTANGFCKAETKNPPVKEVKP